MKTMAGKMVETFGEGVINSFVHIIMYLYYMLSAFGPQLHRYLWWKKYITVLQMAQFLIVFLHNAQLLFNDCNYPKASLIFILPNAGFFMYLFNDFYKKAYEKKNSELPDEIRKTQKEVKSKRDVGKASSMVNANGQVLNNNEYVNDIKKVEERDSTKSQSASQKKTN